MRGFKKDSYYSLLADIAIGNQQAFTKLYDLFYPALIKYVVSKIKDPSSAEDILHDLFMSLWRGRAKIQEIESLSAYLYTSCRYLIFEYIRKSSVWNTHEDLADLDMQYMETPLDERLYYRYLLDMVNKEIENLPEKCRQVFKLSREELKTNKEIAQYMGISESTVENQINKALRRLKIVSKDYFVFLTLFP